MRHAAIVGSQHGSGELLLELTLQAAHELGKAGAALSLETLGLQDRLHLGKGVVDVSVVDQNVVFGALVGAIATQIAAVRDELEWMGELAERSLDGTTGRRIDRPAEGDGEPPIRRSPDPSISPP